MTSVNASQVIEEAYRTMHPRNFSADVCKLIAPRLRVFPAGAVGWSDWGSEKRILASLQRMGKLDECLARLDRRRNQRPSAFLMPEYRNQKLLAVRKFQ